MNHRCLGLVSVLAVLLLLLLGVDNSHAWTTTTTASGRLCRNPPSSSHVLLAVKNCNNVDVPSTEDSKLEVISYSSSDAQSSRRHWLQQGLATSALSSLLVLLQPSKTLAAASPAVIVSTEATCDPTVSVWKRGDRLVYLLGTAHISQVSAQLAGQLVQDVHPNAVFVELDLKRVGGLQQKTKSSAEVTRSVDLGLQQEQPPNVPTSRLLVPAMTSPPPGIVVEATSSSPSSSSGTVGMVPLEDAAAAAISPDTKNKKKGLFSFGLGTDFGAAAVGSAIRGMYKNLDQAGFRPGDEFVEAVREGRRIGADIVLGDRDVQVTLRRLTQALQVTDWNKLMDPNSELEQSMRELLPSSSGGGGTTQQQLQLPPTSETGFKEEMSAFVESIKTRERVRKIMSQLNEVAPALVQVMLTERDAYMAAGLDSLNQYLVIVAVMGIAHQDGVEQNLRNMGWKQVQPRCRR